MKTKEKKLTAKQKLFCDWYIKLANGTQAAIKAGYSTKTAYSIASENLRKPEIVAYLKVRRTQLEEILEFNKATVLQDLHTIKQMSMRAVAVMRFDQKEKRMVQVTEEWMDDKGVSHEAGVYEYDSNGANRAIENINKMMGYNEPDKVEDVTPLDRKTPTTIVVNKSYVNKEPDQSST